MSKLISKVQHKNFESGEFNDITLRNFDELVILIEQFPWEVERMKIQISLTNPSITVEKNETQFLKLALYYNGKFVLHFYDSADDKLYSMSLLSYDESHQVFKNYYEQDNFDLVGFKKDNTWMQKNAIHFITQDFNYIVSQKSATKYLWKTSGMNGVIFFIFFAAICFKISWNSILISLAFIFPFFLLIVGANITLFVRFLFYSKEKVLIMSKGNDLFYFGDKSNPKEFNKKEIEQAIIYRNKNNKNPINGFAYIKIIFKDKTKLIIPNIFVDYPALQDKLFSYPQTDFNSGLIRLLKLK